MSSICYARKNLQMGEYLFVTVVGRVGLGLRACTWKSGFGFLFCVQECFKEWYSFWVLFRGFELVMGVRGSDESGRSAC